MKEVFDILMTTFMVFNFSKISKENMTNMLIAFFKQNIFFLKEELVTLIFKDSKLFGLLLLVPGLGILYNIYKENQLTYFRETEY